MVIAGLLAGGVHDARSLFQVDFNAVIKQHLPAHGGHIQTAETTSVVAFEYGNGSAETSSGLRGVGARHTATNHNHVVVFGFRDIGNCFGFHFPRMFANAVARIGFRFA